MQYNVKRSDKLAKLQSIEQDSKTKEVLDNAENMQNVNIANITQDIQDNIQQEAQKDNQMSQQSPQSNNPNKESSTKKGDKKNFSFYMSEGKLKAIDEFLKDFGRNGESRNSFVEEATEYYLLKRKSELKKELEEKLKKI